MEFQMDPNLGYNHIGDGIYTGFKKYGLDGAPIIVTLGNSTTDPWQFPFKNWSQLLYEELLKNGIKACILCGGISGYMSSQELLKLLRDVLPLHPKMVICYEGFQDIHMLFREKEYPFVSKYQKTYLSKLNIDQWIDIYYTKGYSMGIDSHFTAYQLWKYCMRCMYALCKEFGVRYYGILQPSIYNSLPSPSGKEWEVLLHCEVRDDYLRCFEKFFEEYRNDDWNPSYIHDLTNILKGDGEEWIDTVHVTEGGNKRIAQAIYAAIKNDF